MHAMARAWVAAHLPTRAGRATFSMARVAQARGLSHAPLQDAVARAAVLSRRGASRALAQRAGATSGIGFGLDSPDVSPLSRGWRKNRLLNDRVHAGLYRGPQHVVVSTAMLAWSWCRALTRARPEDVGDEFDQLVENEQKRAALDDCARSRVGGLGVDRGRRERGKRAV